MLLESATVPEALVEPEPLALPLSELLLPLVLLESLLVLLLESLLATEESEDVRPVGDRLSLEPVELVLPVDAVEPVEPAPEDWLASEESDAVEFEPEFAPVAEVLEEVPDAEVEPVSEPERLAVRLVESALIEPLPLTEPEAAPLPLALSEELVSLLELLAVELKLGLEAEPLELASVLCADCEVEPNEPLVEPLLVEAGELLLLSSEEEVDADGLEADAEVLYVLFCVLLVALVFVALAVLLTLEPPDVVVSRLPEVEPVPARPKEPEALVLFAEVLLAVVEFASAVFALCALTEALLV